ncbi:polysaccharide deacetylase family protein [Streptomyces sp. NPDC001941]|uniref:polysaccharide deacetylase family protein n=1 Tax=Streptomyces sp. NPDC001941 TaxID=3154659 RepID=UPI003322E5E3
MNRPNPLSGKNRSAIALLTAALLVVIAAAAAAVLLRGNDEGNDPGRSDAKPSARKVDPSIVHASERAGRSVNITIDDGPSPRWTPQVLDVLAQYGVKATFCMIGPEARAHPDLVKKVVAAGHRLCDHSVHHDTGMAEKTEDYQSHEVLDAEKMIEDASGGAPVDYFRAPGGSFDPYNRHLAADHGMRPLGWNVDSEDFKKPGAAKIVSTVERELSPEHPTVLFHDGGGDRDQTVAALKELLPWMKEQGYGFGFPKR